MEYFALAFFISSIVVFFLIIALTLILGGVSRVADKRVAREGRATSHQRLPGQREAHSTP
jgi:hypothetical protein